MTEFTDSHAPYRVYAPRYSLCSNKLETYLRYKEIPYTPAIPTPGILQTIKRKYRWSLTCRAAGITAHFRIELLLAAKVIIDRSYINISPAANITHGSILETLLSKDLKGRLQQPFTNPAIFLRMCILHSRFIPVKNNDQTLV